MKKHLLASIIGSTIILTGCGGGSSPAPTPTPVVPPSGNAAPTFSSASAVTVDENVSGAIYTAAATDADGDPLTFSISGGVDQALFELNSTNELSFVRAPNFEDPLDDGANNDYAVTLSVSDGQGGSDNLNLIVSIIDVANEMIRNKDVVFDRALVEQNVLFRTVGGQDLFMDIFTPEGDTETNRPVMIVAFGGGFVAGNRTSVAGIAANFATRGYVAAAIDYRLFTNGTPTDLELVDISVKATQDMFAAVRFFREDANGPNTYGTNPNQIFVSGVSAGAVMASSAGTLDPSDDAIAVLTPFLGSGGLYGDNTTEAENRVQGILSISGAVLSLDAIDANSAPLYAAHEELDPVVPCNTAGEGSSSTGLEVSGGCDMKPRYDEVGVPARLYLLESVAAHVGFTVDQFLEIFQGAADLFYAEVISQEE